MVLRYRGPRTCVAGQRCKQTISVDYFLYDRCYVIAIGASFYEKVLHEPSEFPAGCSFEELLYVAAAAFEKKTGKTYFLHVPAFDYETYSNEIGWPEP